jgi:AP-2 complex subunit mu-1
MQATGALSWRRPDIKYRKNEAFVDVIEDVNLLMSAAGTVLRADVTGQIVMRAYLSGMPECKFGLNDRLQLDPTDDNKQHKRRSGGGGGAIPSGATTTTTTNKGGSGAGAGAAVGSVTLEDCQFHQCVQLGRFDADRTISFVPPDGEFELMRYRATDPLSLPFRVHAIVHEVGRARVEYSVAVRATFGSKLFATNVVVRVPTPLNTARVSERASQGKARYEPEHNCIVWRIARFGGQNEHVLSAEAALLGTTASAGSSGAAGASGAAGGAAAAAAAAGTAAGTGMGTGTRTWSRPPLSMSFSLLMFTSSGLLVRYLKVFEKSGYSSIKWVRYMTRAGSYEIR